MTLVVVTDLRGAGLADIDVGGAVQMRRTDLRTHGSSPCSVHYGRAQLGNEGVALLALWLGELLPDGGMGQGQPLLRSWVAERALGHHELLSVVMPKT